MKKNRFLRIPGVSTLANIVGCLLLTVTFFFSACKKPDNFVGKEYKEASKDLSVVYFETNGSNSELAAGIDFTKDSVSVSGELSERVTWYVTFRGLSSGAVKKIDGLSQVIDPSTAKWGGDHDPSTLRFFQKGEKVVAELSFLNSSVVRTDTFTIKEPKKFKGDVLFNGFENTLGFYGWGNNYLFFNETDPLSNPANPMTFAMNNKLSVEGKQSLSIMGADNDNTYFIGGARTFIPNGPRHFPFASFNPDSVYFNFYVYGLPDYRNTRVSIGIAEDDNANGVFEPTSEDVWEFAVKINWVGWRLISVKYSDFATSASRTNGGSGNKRMELDRVKHITFNILSDPAGNRASYLIDFPIITYGETFSPTK